MSVEAKAVHPLIRPLTWGDLDRIMEIELAAYPVPWTRGIFGDCIRVGYDCWGLQREGELIGYRGVVSDVTEASSPCSSIRPMGLSNRRRYGEVMARD